VPRSSRIDQGSGYSIEIRGGQELASVGRRLRKAGAGELRRELLRGVREVAKPVIPKIRANALETLPRSGGLAAEYAAHKIAVRTSLAERSANVRIVSTDRGRLRSVNAGRLRHPVFGNTDVWAQQKVEPGWFDKPIYRDAGRIRLGVRRVLSGVASRIERTAT
jgi:hypothetical protein